MYLWSCILFSRLLCNVAFATCTYRLQPHRAARTSIPLRSIRSARFLTRLADASPSVQCVGRGFRHMYAPAPAAWRNAYLDSASLHLGRGFRHMHAPAPAASSSAYLDSASLHLGRGFRHIEKKKESHGEMQALPHGSPSSFPRCSMLNVKNRRPHGSQCPQKQRFLSARSGVRTLDTLIKSQVLCQLS